MIRDFAELTEEFNSRIINPEFHFVDNEAPIYLNIPMTTMDIKYQLVPPSNHR